MMYMYIDIHCNRIVNSYLTQELGLGSGGGGGENSLLNQSAHFCNFDNN